MFVLNLAVLSTDHGDQLLSLCCLYSTDDTQRYQCGYCGCDITLRLKCAECSDLDLCLHVSATVSMYGMCGS